MHKDDNSDVTVKQAKSSWVPASLSLTSGLLIGPVFFTTISQLNSGFSKEVREGALKGVTSLAIALTVLAFVCTVLAVLRSKGQPGAPRTMAGVGLVLVLMFWGAIGALFYLSNKFF